jgi:hypothetical protein
MLLPNQFDARLISAFEDEVRFFSGARKDDRERWVFDHWCSLTGRNASHGTKGEGPDFELNGELIEIVEVLVKGRKRHKEYLDDLAALHTGTRNLKDLIHDGPGLETIKSIAHVWVLAAITDKHKHYGSSSLSWTLLIYANFTFADRANWDAVKTELTRRTPGFARIEVLFADGTQSRPLY